MRLINADELHNALKQQQRWVVKREGFTNEGYSYDQVHFTIDKMPTIEPIRHGRWIYKELGYPLSQNFYICSECGYPHGLAIDNYCSHCGAKMDEEGEEK